MNNLQVLIEEKRRALREMRRRQKRRMMHCVAHSWADVAAESSIKQMQLEICNLKMQQKKP